MKAERILTVKEFAALLGVPAPRVRLLIYQGRIKTIHKNPYWISPQDNSELVEFYKLKNKLKQVAAELK